MSRIIVSSAKKLEKAQTERITAAIKEKNGKDTEIKFEVNPSLLGGIVIKKDDVILDGSVSRELNNIKEYLSR